MGESQSSFHSHSRAKLIRIVCLFDFKGRIPTPFIEGWYDVAHIPWTTEGKLTLSNGDQTGYSIHVSSIESDLQLIVGAD